jgi:hypothetical protein
MVRRWEIPAAMGLERAEGLAKERMGWRFAWAKRETKGRREDIFLTASNDVPGMCRSGGRGSYREIGSRVVEDLGQ